MIPVVIVTKGGAPVTQVASGAPLMQVAANGLGTPITLVPSGGAPFVVAGAYPAGTFLLDTITDVDGTLLQNHAPELGGPITRNNASDIVISGGRAYLSGATIARYTYATTPPNPDYEVTAVFDKLSTVAGEQPGFTIRMTSGIAFYRLRWNGTNNMWDLLANTTVLASYLDAFSPGQSRTVSLRAVGSTLTVTIDGVAQTPVTDATFSAAGSVGLIWLTQQTATTGVQITSLQARTV